MDISISKHAAERAAERGITEDGIRAIVFGVSGSFVTIRSGNDPEAVIFLGMYAGKLWSIVLNQNTMNVITVRRARKDEEDKYDKGTRG